MGHAKGTQMQSPISMPRAPGWVAEFRAFIMRDLAVGIIIGVAFSAIVGSLVKDILYPIIGLAIGGVDFSNIFIALNGQHYDLLDAAQKAAAPTVNVGVFINTIINFVIICRSRRRLCDRNVCSCVCRDVMVAALRRRNVTKTAVLHTEDPTVKLSSPVVLDFDLLASACKAVAGAGGMGTDVGFDFIGVAINKTLVGDVAGAVALGLTIPCRAAWVGARHRERSAK